MDGVWDLLFGSPAFLTFGLYTVVMVIGLSLLLHLQMGLAGIGNFGVVGFWGVGMYSFGVLIVTYEWPYLAALLGASGLAGVAGVAVGWLIADLDTDGVLGATLSFATIVFLLADGERDLTGGQVGLGTIDFPFDIGVRTDVAWLAILAAIVGALLYYVHRVHRSPYGRLLIAVGDNEALARSLGKTTFHSKVVLLAAVVGGDGAARRALRVDEPFPVPIARRRPTHDRGRRRLGPRRVSPTAGFDRRCPPDRRPVRRRHQGVRSASS